jgi:hypothetical protein
MSPVAEVAADIETKALVSLKSVAETADWYSAAAAEGELLLHLRCYQRQPAGV